MIMGKQTELYLGGKEPLHNYPSVACGAQKWCRMTYPSPQFWRLCIFAKLFVPACLMWIFVIISKFADKWKRQVRSWPSKGGHVHQNQ